MIVKALNFALCQGMVDFTVALQAGGCCSNPSDKPKPKDALEERYEEYVKDAQTRTDGHLKNGVGIGEMMLDTKRGPVVWTDGKGFGYRTKAPWFARLRDSKAQDRLVIGCKKWTSGDREGQIYCGPFENGEPKAKAKGWLEFKDGTDYKGDLLNGQMHGDGCMQWTLGARKGQIYYGPFEHGKPKAEAEGWMKYPDGSEYKGGLLNLKRNGKGSYKSADGMCEYSGGYKNGKKHGQCTETLRKDIRNKTEDSPHKYILETYEGGYNNGNKHGKCTVTEVEYTSPRTGKDTPQKREIRTTKGEYENGIDLVEKRRLEQVRREIIRQQRQEEAERKAAEERHLQWLAKEEERKAKERLKPLPPRRGCVIYKNEDGSQDYYRIYPNYVKIDGQNRDVYFYRGYIFEYNPNTSRMQFYRRLTSWEYWERWPGLKLDNIYFAPDEREPIEGDELNLYTEILVPR